MEELTKKDLSLFYDEELYIIKEDLTASGTIEKPTYEKEHIKTASPIAEEPREASIALAYKGGNAKEIALIVNDDTNEFLNNTDETLLLNILKAIGLSLEDVAIINQHKTGVTWEKQIDFTKAIVFGILPSTYHLVSENYNIVQKEGVPWLFSDSLFKLANDKVLKGKLWNKLQELFK